MDVEHQLIAHVGDRVNIGVESRADVAALKAARHVKVRHRPIDPGIDQVVVGVVDNLAVGRRIVQSGPVPSQGVAEDVALEVRHSGVLGLTPHLKDERSKLARAVYLQVDTRALGGIVIRHDLPDYGDTENNR